MPKLLNTQTISQIKVIFLSQAVTFLSWVSAVFSQATGLPAPFHKRPNQEPTAIYKIHRYEVRNQKYGKKNETAKIHPGQDFWMPLHITAIHIHIGYCPR